MPAESKTPADAEQTRQGKDSGVGQRLRNLRGTRSQRDFATMVGINKSSLGRYERGESYPDAGDLQKLCSKLEVNPDWILFGGERKVYRSGKRKESYCKTCELLMRMLEDEARTRREQEQEVRKLVTAVAELKAAVGLLPGVKAGE